MFSASGAPIPVAAPKEEPFITTVREMQGLRSKLLESARIARKNLQWNKARIADDMGDAILRDLNAVNEGEGVESLQAALAATKQYKRRFESGIVGKIRGYSKSGIPTIEPELTLDISIGRRGQKAALRFEDIGRITPEAEAATKRYLARSFTDYATEGATNRINPIKANDWIRNNEAVLDKVPGLRSQMMDVAKAQDLANKTRVAMDARKAALRDPKVSASARFLNTADMDKEVHSIFQSPTSFKMANQLARQARKDPTGLALQGLRGGTVDYMLEKSSVGSFNELGEKTLSGNTLLGFINDNSATLGQVFEPQQIARMRRIGTELAKIEKVERIKPGEDIELKDVASSALVLFARVAGARIGGIWGRESAGGSLQMAQIFSSKAKGFVMRLSKDRAAEMVHDAILSDDPALLKALLLPIDKPGTARFDLHMQTLNNQMNLWLAGTGSRVWEDIRNEQNEIGAAR